MISGEPGRDRTTPAGRIQGHDGGDRTEPATVTARTNVQFSEVRRKANWCRFTSFDRSSHRTRQNPPRRRHLQWCGVFQFEARNGVGRSRGVDQFRSLDAGSTTVHDRRTTIHGRRRSPRRTLNADASLAVTTSCTCAVCSSVILVPSRRRRGVPLTRSRARSSDEVPRRIDVGYPEDRDEAETRLQQLEAPAE